MARGSHPVDKKCALNPRPDGIKKSDIHNDMMSCCIIYYVSHYRHHTPLPSSSAARTVALYRSTAEHRSIGQQEIGLLAHRCGSVSLHISHKPCDTKQGCPLSKSHTGDACKQPYIRITRTPHRLLQSQPSCSGPCRTSKTMVYSAWLCRSHNRITTHQNLGVCAQKTLQTFTHSK